MKRYTITVRGRVQGVFFRDFARSLARRMNVFGYVRNARDGSVEIVAEAGEEVLRAFVGALRGAEYPRRVDSVDVSESEATNEFGGFSIRY
ncbi:MAG: acylphosphatase [Candidatus Diapherotrites archaeon]|nr:acylphosphatase [Candidatus Diapherotrites archaeon]